MATLLVRILLFLSSYAPLLVIIGIRHYNDSQGLAIAAFAVAVLGVCALFIYIRAARRMSPVQIDTNAVEARSGETMGYIVTYLIPFLDFNLGDTEDAIALAVLIFILGVIYVNSNLVTVNPILNLAGFHLFEVSTSDGPRKTLLSRRSYIPPKGTLSAVALGNYALMEKER